MNLGFGINVSIEDKGKRVIEEKRLFLLLGFKSYFVKEIIKIKEDNTSHFF